MKNTLKAFTLFTILTVQVLADKENLLKDACGHVALSSDQILGIYSWGEVRHVVIGSVDCPESFQISLDHLSNISYETMDDTIIPKELVAERAPWGRARYCEMQCTPR
ncbi:MAG TPA: hypothetical protein VGP47_06355 [Parachlamydiaceae bacterium]|nr:hypothetical protein [Parachlamydiaceae bacterium]